MLSLCCDYRVQTLHKTSTFGLNEVMLGIPVPKFWAMRFCEVTEQSVGREVVVTRRVGKPREGVEIWVDRLGREEGMLEKRVMEIAEKMKQVPRDGYAKTKVNLRGEFAEQWYRYGCDEEARDGFECCANQPSPEAAKTGFRWVEKRSRSKKASSKL